MISMDWVIADLTAHCCVTLNGCIVLVCRMAKCDCVDKVAVFAAFRAWRLVAPDCTNSRFDAKGSRVPVCVSAHKHACVLPGPAAAKRQASRM